MPDGRQAASTRVAASALALAALLSACAGRGGALPAEGTCRHPIAGRGALDTTLEEASFVTGGEAFRIYGAGGEPVRRVTTGEIVEVDGVSVWLLEAEFEVMVEDERRVDGWRMWLGFHEDELAVLCAIGPDDVPWPARDG